MGLIALGVLLNSALAAWALGAFDLDDIFGGQNGNGQNDEDDDPFGDDERAGLGWPGGFDDGDDTDTGDDTTGGGTGDDTAGGGTGDDTTGGGTGDDTTGGGTGDDMTGDDTADGLDGVILDGQGTAADDILLVGDVPTMTGGGGDDIFYIARALEDGTLAPTSGVSINDFDEGDRIVWLLDPEDDTDPGRIGAYEWRVLESGVELSFLREGADGPERVSVALLKDIDAIPEGLVVASDLRPGAATAPVAPDIAGVQALTGENEPYVITETGDDGPQSYLFDDLTDFETANGFPAPNSADVSRLVFLDSGGGDDVVQVSAAVASVDLGDGNDTYIGTSSTAQGATDLPQETVLAGPGDDTVTVGESQFVVRGDSGDDVIDLRAGQAGNAQAGSGADTLIAAPLAPVAAVDDAAAIVLSGDAGVDMFRIVLGDDFSGAGGVAGSDPTLDASIRITDFEQGVERLTVEIPGDYDVDPDVTIEQRSIGGVDNGVVLVNGFPVVRVEGVVLTADDLDIVSAATLV